MSKFLSFFRFGKERLILISFGLFLTSFPLISQEQSRCSDLADKSKISQAYLQSKEALTETPHMFPCLRIFFLTEPSLEVLRFTLSESEVYLSPHERFELHTIALAKAMAGKNVNLGLEWGKKIFAEWREREESHKSIYFYAYFLYVSDDLAASKEVLHWLQSNTNKKSILKKVNLLSKQLEIP